MGRIKRSELGFLGFKDIRIMKYEQLTHKIIGCAMKVQSTLGNGFQEVIISEPWLLKWKNKDSDLSGKWR